MQAKANGAEIRINVIVQKSTNLSEKVLSSNYSPSEKNSAIKS